MWKKVRICDLCACDGRASMAVGQYQTRDGKWHDVCESCLDNDVGASARREFESAGDVELEQ